MKRIISNTVVVLLLILITACSHLEKTIIDDIKNEKQKYKELVETIYKCDFSRFSDGQFISKRHFPNTLKDVLNNTKLKDKVDYIILLKNSDCDQKPFELICGRYQIMYDPCPKSDFPLPDSYLEEGVIETWGINENWIVWKDNDYM